MAREEARARVIEDADTLTNMTVNSNGSINTVPTPPIVPTDATPVDITVFNDVSSTSGVDTTYTITNGDTLYIQQFVAASEGETGGSVVELYYDPNGNATGMTLIAVIILDATTISIPLDESYTGDGTARILMRRRGYTNSKREIFAKWSGYEE